MRDSPSPTAGNGRDRKGRFTSGNAAATGNPFAAKVARLRAALLSAVTEEDIGEVLATLVANAKAGDMAAVKELLLRTIGRPVESDLLQRLEDLESALEVKEHAPRCR